MIARLYSNENFPLPVVEVLRHMGQGRHLVLNDVQPIRTTVSGGGAGI